MIVDVPVVFILDGEELVNLVDFRFIDPQYEEWSTAVFEAYDAI
jgi:hypothetical protein